MHKLNYKSFVLDIPSQVYLPSDDTYFFLDILKENLKKEYKSALEIGFGNALLSLEIYNKCNKLICVDINKYAINYFKKLKRKYNLKNLIIKKSNLFENLNKKYDLIIFNPPYVPTHSKFEDLKEIDLATCGGKDGLEIITPFLKDLKNYLKKQGECYLLFSSLNNTNNNIYNILKKGNLNYKILGIKPLFFEKLIIIKIQKR